MRKLPFCLSGCWPDPGQIFFLLAPTPSPIGSTHFWHPRVGSRSHVANLRHVKETSLLEKKDLDEVERNVSIKIGNIFCTVNFFGLVKRKL